MVRKAIYLLAGASLIAALAIPAAAHRPQPSRRVEVIRYRGPALNTSTTGEAGICFSPTNTGCIPLDIWPGETAVEIEIQDDLSPKVAGVFHQEGDAGQSQNSHFCGSTKQPIEIEEWTTYASVRVLTRPCDDGTEAMATRGTLQVSYVNENGSRPTPTVRREHVETGTYIAPAIQEHVATGLFLGCHAGRGWGCVAFTPRPSDRFVSIEIKDDSGLPVAGYVYQLENFLERGDADSVVARDTEFCGETTEPIALHPKADWVGVSLGAGPCGDGTPAMATSGEAVFTFSNMP